MKQVLLLAGVAAFISVSAQATEPAYAEDGDLALPANYSAWPKFLSAVQRPDIKQVREIFVNPIGYETKAGRSYAHGTLFVMENWAAKTNTNGSLVTDANGKLIKDRLLRVFIMGKGAGFGAKVPTELKNGDWVYASYDHAGNKAPDNFSACRACHLPLTSKDFVQRYDEFFAVRGK